jgi:hypothetical protein
MGRLYQFRKVCLRNLVKNSGTVYYVEGIKRQVWPVSPTKIRIHAKREFSGRLKMQLRLDGVAKLQKGSARVIYWLTGSILEPALEFLAYLSEVTLR